MIYYSAMATKEKIIIKRLHGEDVETIIELPQIPLDGDVIEIPTERIDMLGTGEKIAVKVLNVRMRFDLESNTDHTEIIAEVIDS
jgi:hypothetical protein